MTHHVDFCKNSLRKIAKDAICVAGRIATKFCAIVLATGKNPSTSHSSIRGYHSADAENPCAPNHIHRTVMLLQCGRSIGSWHHSKAILNEFLAFLTIIGIALQCYLIDWETEECAQAGRRIIWVCRVTSRYRQMIADIKFGAELYEYQLSRRHS